MATYIIKRLLAALPTIVGVFAAVFFVIRMIPGDPALSMLGAGATDSQIAVYRQKYGLDEPLPVQFAIAFKGFATGDLGESISLRKPTAEAIMERLPNTVELSLLGIAIGAALAIILGVAAAVNRGSWIDMLLTSISTLGMSLPTFYIGLWVLMIFAMNLKIIPVLSNASDVPHWKSLLGPLVTMVIGETSMLARTTRSSMLEIFDEDFIRTARAKGLGERAILFKHALGNALIPIVTVTGYNLATAFGGAIVLESVFTRNGVGKLLIDAINARDYPLVQGAAIVIAVIMIFINILTDVIYGFIDPRIRVAGDDRN
ncbi:MAG: ABC transporter permease [Clostridiales bacterium]|jgi:ABC-type dipeptide/oligopeptide/nickel transport system permease component|nr:ABC transporter permease [Clostridiales bacterium]